jgi:hypothetical protein
VLKRLSVVLLVLPLLGAARPGLAWEEKGHRIISRVAAESMPAGTPAFFKNAADRLEYLGPEPDRWRSGAPAQLAAVNGPDHFMDMEPVLNSPLPADRYKFIASLATNADAVKHKLTAEKIGFLPYRIAELTEILQSEWRDWRKADAADKPVIEQSIVYTAGILGHYVGDGSNPHHTTVHYNGWDEDYAPNPNGYTTAAAERDLRPDGFHHRFEGAFVVAEIEAKDVKPLVAPVKPIKDIFADTWAYLKTTNSQVKPLYDLEKKGAFKTEGTPDPEGLKFTRDRLAAGASMLRDIWAYAMTGVARSRATVRANGGS